MASPDPSPEPSRVRSARRAAGLSQVELAARAGVSRQLVGTVETGRHLPRVDAALAIARVLGVEVGALFGCGAPVDVLGGAAPREGELVRAARVRDRVVTAPVRAGRDGWDVADAVVEDGALTHLGDVRPGFAVAGCEPGLVVLERLLREAGTCAVAVACSSRAALAALSAGRLHAAVVHGPDDGLPSHEGRAVTRIRLARWAVGLAAPSDAPAGWWTEALSGQAEVVQREHGAGVQRAFEQAVTATVGPAGDARRTGDQVPGPHVGGHLEAARLAVGTGRPGVTIEPAALAVGATFHALEVHEAQLWVADDLRGDPGLAAALDVLTGRGFRRRLAGVGGYDLTGCGAAA